MEAFGLVAAVVVPLVLIAVGIRVGAELERRRGRAGVFHRILLLLASRAGGFGAGLAHMARLLPRYWSEHPDSKHPRHSDHWPPR